jgi:NAD(P)H-nitrite reductase large subunit
MTAPSHPSDPPDPQIPLPRDDFAPARQQDADGSLLVCYCMHVSEARIRAAIAAGCRTVDMVRRATTACSGCQTCRYDIEALIAAAGGDRAPAPSASGIRPLPPPRLS